MLRVVVDESTGRAVAACLAAAGCDVVFVPDVLPGASDTVILAFAEREERLVVTNDKDFGELVFRSGQGRCGVVLFRLADENVANRVRMAQMVLREHATRLWKHMVVVTERTVRVRPMPDSSPRAITLEDVTAAEDEP